MRLINRSHEKHNHIDKHCAKPPIISTNTSLRHTWMALIPDTADATETFWMNRSHAVPRRNHIMLVRECQGHISVFGERYPLPSRSRSHNGILIPNCDLNIQQYIQLDVTSARALGLERVDVLQLTQIYICCNACVNL